jgi:hypothetical protein
MLLTHQHPSWKAAAIWVLDKINMKTNKWKQKRTKLILIKFDAPKQAVSGSPLALDYFGQSTRIFSGNQSIKDLAVNITAIESPIQHI